MALLPLIASVVLFGITSQYANGAGLDPDKLRRGERQGIILVLFHLSEI